MYRLGFLLLFVGLKLTGFIDWSWLWVLAPLWIELAIVLALFVIITVVGIVGGLVHDAVNKWK